MLEQQVADLQNQLADRLRELDDQECKCARETDELNRMIIEMQKCITDITSDKESLEMEIRVYEKLLRGEESK